MIIALDARPLIRSQIQGAEQRARNILSAWARSGGGHQFYLLYPRTPSGAIFDESLLATLPANFRRVEITSFAMPHSFRTASRLLNPLARAIGRIKPDIYHSFTPDVPRVSTCAVVPTLHDLSFELDPVVSRTPAGRALHRAAVRGIKWASRVVAVSSQTKYDIASVYRFAPERIDVVYNGIDAAFRPAPATAIPTPKPVHLRNDILRPYLLSVGADIPRRNYARMLAAMQIVWKTQDGARIKWVLAGRAEWKESEIYAAAKRAGVLERVRFVFAPDNTELADLYRGASQTVCASSFEGFGLSVLESMACGTAVACSDMRSLREVAEEAAVYFPHDDAEAMGQAIAGLLEDAEYRRQLKYRGIYRASLFTWETAAQLTLASLQTACAKPVPVTTVETQ
ncbi:MAG TPA: glycosyltransferase family 1 protein [Phycisphaerae bacterium]|jgi:glycosyltransferase involved in cell wall biosynthesis